MRIREKTTGGFILNSRSKMAERKKRILNKGAYCLIMSLNKDVGIKVGRFGFFNFPRGHYVYVGSAMKNLKQRVSRHFRDEKKLKWHIDYFLENAQLVRALVYPSRKRLESKIAKLFEDEVKVGRANIIVKKFGSTDTKDLTHLFYFPSENSLKESLKIIRKKIKKI